MGLIAAPSPFSVSSPLLANLNDEQRAAVTLPDEHALILAGAGSGKTRVLTTRIAWLLQEGRVSPGGLLAVTVPTFLPERICWALSDEYHAPFVEGGHVRIFTEASLRRRFRDAGLEPGAVHHAHALHSPYWWLKCAVGPTNDDNPLVQAYLKLLTWDIMKAPKLTRWTEKALNPVLGKSLVLYARKPVVA